MNHIPVELSAKSIIWSVDAFKHGLKDLKSLP